MLSGEFLNMPGGPWLSIGGGRRTDPAVVPGGGGGGPGGGGGGAPAIPCMK